MKQYKHKQSGKIATYECGIYYIGNYTLAPWMVENSCDWEEIKPITKCFACGRDNLTLNFKWECPCGLWPKKEETYPIGTKIMDEGRQLEKIEENYWIEAHAFSIAYTDYTVYTRIKAGLATLVKKEKKPEYTILSLKSDKEKVYIEEFGEKGFSMFKNNREYWIEHRLNLLHWNIYSIRRESDGEIFTIGDSVTHCLDDRDRGIIYSFEITNNKEILVRFGGVRDCDTNYLYKNTISVLNKKTKLFTTEDGVDIYKGDKFFYIHPSYDKNTVWSACASDNIEYNHKNSFYTKKFSTEEKLKEYLFNNNQLFSLQMLLNNFTFSTLEKNKLLEIAKTLSK